MSVNERLSNLLKILTTRGGSDLYLTTGCVPAIKLHGEVERLNEFPVFNPGEIKLLANEIMNQEQQEKFESSPECNLGLSAPHIGRFRVNIFKQRGETAMVFRHIKTDIPTIDSLGLPTILKNLVLEKTGLILLVGATGSGKSTTMAAMIDHRNFHSSGHIITIEDPIEFLHRHEHSIINQREVGIDTLSYEEAMKNALRQAPDVISLGEVRTQETMEKAISYAETGHLCLTTLHSTNSYQALERIINFFPVERHNQILLDLSLNLRAIISLRLIPNTQNSRTAVFEILLATPLISELIRRGKIEEIKDVIERSTALGMQTFDQCLFEKVKEGFITCGEALRNADFPNNLRLKLSMDLVTREQLQAYTLDKEEKNILNEKVPSQDYELTGGLRLQTDEYGR